MRQMTDDPIITADPPEAERPTFAALKPRQCKWPYGDGTAMTFCGRPAPLGKPYCEHHTIKARRRIIVGTSENT
jgi:hypothetical protein